MIEIEKNEKSSEKPLIRLLNSLNYESDKVTFTGDDYQYIKQDECF